MSDTSRGKRLYGTALRVAATLIETPGTAFAVYTVASKQLGLPELRNIAIPPHTTMFRFLHLDASREGGRDG